MRGMTCIRCGADDTWYLCQECTKKANAAVEVTKVEIPPELYDRWRKLYSGDTLGANQARGIISYEGKTFVNSGGRLDVYFDAHEVVPAWMWEGPTYTYDELTDVNGSGGPFHSNNQKFKFKGDEWVIVPNKVTRFIREDKPVYQQSSLFQEDK